MSKSIRINTGERVNIENSDGELMGYFYFNPADVDMITRCDVVRKNLDKILDELKEAEAAEEAIIKANNGIREQMDYLLGNEAGKILFKYNSPISVMADGTIYGLYAFNAVAAFIEQEVTERSEKMKSQIDKYTAQYDK